MPRSPSSRRSRCACAGVASCIASATSSVRLPSRRSSPAGLPVTAGSPKTPSTSSRSWNASPSGSPYALSAANVSSGAACGGGTEMQRPLDGVLARLEPGHSQGVVRGELAAGLDEHVEVLTGHHELPHVVVDVPRAAAPRQAGSAAAANIASAHDSSRSPSRIAAAAPNSRDHPSTRSRGAGPRTPRGWPGRPRRVAEASMTSSWTSAHACSSSRLAADDRRARGRRRPTDRTAAPAPVGEARAQPLAALQNKASCLLATGASSGPTSASDVARGRRRNAASVASTRLIRSASAGPVTRRTLRWRHVTNGPGSPRTRQADVLLRVLPAQDRAGRAPAVADDPRAGAAEAVVRLGHLRCRRVDARQHDPRSPSTSRPTPRCCRSPT